MTYLRKHLLLLAIVIGLGVSAYLVGRQTNPNGAIFIICFFIIILSLFAFLSILKKLSPERLERQRELERAFVGLKRSQIMVESTLRKLERSSDRWKCPHCGEVFKKTEGYIFSEVLASMGSSLGKFSCPSCHKPLDEQILAWGLSDAPEGNKELKGYGGSREDKSWGTASSQLSAPYRCSECGFVSTMTDGLCPNCGSKEL